MLKFLRKYQLFIMIIGGSLLMVVFLLEPVITRLAPTTANRTIATIGPDQTKISAMDRERANAEFSAVRAIAPILVSPFFIGLDPQEPGDHWLLLSREAEANGLIGEAGDGRSWIPELADVIAQFEERARVNQMFASVQGLPQSFLNQLIAQNMNQGAIDARAQQLRTELPLSVSNATAGNYFLKTNDDTYRALATARGINRLLTLHRTSARRSLPESLNIVNDALEGVAVDVLLLQPGLLADSMPAPIPEQLDAHFHRFQNMNPADSDLGIGYILPPRIQFEVLKLDPAPIAAAAPVDRIELMKRFRRNPDRYGTDINAPSTADPSITVSEQLEQEIRNEIAQELVTELEQAIRRSLINTTRNLSSEALTAPVLPADAEIPTLGELAVTVASDIEYADGTSIPAPSYNLYNNRWYTAQDLQALPGIGSASYRLGTASVSAAALPNIVAESTENGVLNEVLPIQVGMPFTANPATDAQGDRYLVNVLASRPESAAESIDEAGRSRVANDFKQVQAYESFVATAQDYLDVARAAAAQGTLADGLPAAADFFNDDALAPQRNIVVQSGGQAVPQSLAALTNEEALEAILAKGRELLDPLQAPDEVDPATAFFSLELPASRSLALVRLVARRPLTTEQNLRFAGGILQQAANAELTNSESFLEDFPYTLEAMARRHQFVLVDQDGEPTESETETETADDTQAVAQSDEQADASDTAAPAEAAED